MPSTRRDFLKAVVAAGVLLPSVGIDRLVCAADPASRAGSDLLVVLFLRGGCDALNLVGPANDRDYVEDRMAPLRVLDQGERAGIPLANGFDPALDFRLHPAAAPLAELYAAGHLAIVHAVGLSNETRSHFVAQELIERGLEREGTQPGSGAAPATGWLARYASLLKLDGLQPGQVPALAAAHGVDQALVGLPNVLAIPDFSRALNVPGGPQAQAVLTALYRSAPGDVAESGRLTLAQFAALDARLPRDADGKVLPYQPEPGVQYDDGSEAAGRGLAAIARLIKMDVGLRVACVDMGGWDTHENQPGRFDRLAGQLGRNLMAFWNDVAAYHDRVTLVVMSEFGRRLRSNKSNGTDHGHGGVMLALGGRVNGGRLYGRWPGLSTPTLDRGVDLAVTTDYRAVLSAVLAPHLAPAQLSQVFPGFVPGADLDLLRRS